MACIGITLVAALVANGWLTEQAFMAAVQAGHATAKRLYALSVDKQGKPTGRQALFQCRAFEHGMPADGTYYAHECTTASNGSKVVQAGRVDCAGHAVLVNGKPVNVSNGKVSNGTGSDYATKALAGLAYAFARDVDYVVHNAQCTVDKVQARQASMTAKVGAITGKVYGKPAGAATKPATARKPKVQGSKGSAVRTRTLTASEQAAHNAARAATQAAHGIK